MPSRPLGIAMLLAFAFANAGGSICAVVHHGGTTRAHGSHDSCGTRAPAVTATAPAHGCSEPLHCGISVIAVGAGGIRPPAIGSAGFTAAPTPTVFAPAPPLALSTPPPRA